MKKVFGFLIIVVVIVAAIRGVGYKKFGWFNNDKAVLEEVVETEIVVDESETGK